MCVRWSHQSFSVLTIQMCCVGRCLVCNITSTRAPRPFFLRTRAASYLPSFSLFLSHSHSHSLSLSPSKLSKASPVKLSIRRRLQRRSASGVVSSAIFYRQSPSRATYSTVPSMRYRTSARPCGVRYSFAPPVQCRIYSPPVRCRTSTRHWDRTSTLASIYALCPQFSTYAPTRTGSLQT